MSVIEGIILGIVQGVTEFLPISSSGHLILTERLLGIESESLTFSLVLHLATLLALVIAMRQKLWERISKPFSKQNGFIIIATVFTAVIAFFLKDRAEKAFDGSMLPFFFLLTAILLISAGFIKKETQMTCAHAAIVGITQGLALFPGLSRSGSTIATARILGVSAKESTDFSFFISIPVILGSSLLDILSGGFSTVQILPLIAGFAAAFVSGLFAIKFMLKFMTKNFDAFAIYLLILSVFLLINDYCLHLI